MVLGGALAAVPAVAAVAGLVAVVAARPRSRQWLVTVTVGVGLVSLLATAVRLLSGTSPRDDRTEVVTGWALVELAALLVLVAVAVRSARSRRGVIFAGLAAVAVPLWILRFGSPTLVTVAAMAGWSLPALVAVGVGGYLRALDQRRARAVVVARQEQRLRLARDLHDFVAHDVSEILAHAHAGQVLGERDPAGVAVTLQRIADAALRSLAALDRTVHMLSEQDDLDGGAVRTPPPTLADLRELADRFTGSGSAAVHLDVDPTLAEPAPDAWSREIAATIHRLVVEAFTNVRRHAPSASRVDVTVERAEPAPALRVTIADDGRQGDGSRAARRTSGLGLSGLDERIRALGGSLEARPGEQGGWRIVAWLPLAPSADFPR